MLLPNVDDVLPKAGVDPKLPEPKVDPPMPVFIPEEPNAPIELEPKVDVVLPNMLFEGVLPKLKVEVGAPKDPAPKAGVAAG